MIFAMTVMAAVVSTMMTRVVLIVAVFGIRGG
jgi:hypothetical protein